MEALELRRLLAVPLAVNDTFSTLENQALTLPAGQTSLYFNGNSYIYSGTHTWTTDDSTFRVVGSPSHVSLDVGGWFLDFAAPTGQALVPGVYTHATRWPFQASGDPGFDVYGCGRGSNTVTGQFTILQYKLDDAGNVLSFAADFEHYSEGGPNVLRGTIMYNYAPPGYRSGVLANDSDADNLALTAQLATQPAHGSISFDDDGTFIYTPERYFNGADQFAYTASNSDGTSAPATVTIQVAPVNQPPTFAIGADQIVEEDSGTHVVPGFVNAISPGPADESDQTVSFRAEAYNPSLFSVQPAIDAAGTLTYTLEPFIHGSSSILVWAVDDGGCDNGGSNGSGGQTFSITVTPVSHAPVASDDAFFTTRDEPLTISPAVPRTSLYFNGNSFIYSGTHTWTLADVSVSATAWGGRVALWVYARDTPNSYYTHEWWLEFAAPAGQLLEPGIYTNATRWAFQDPRGPGLDVYGDGRGSNRVTGQFTIYQCKVDDSGNVLSFAADFEHYSEGGPNVLRGTILYNYVPAVGVLANDFDADHDTLTARLVTSPRHGSLTLNADGSLIYIPDAGFEGIDAFTYVVNDGQFDSAPATAHITVGRHPANDGFADATVLREGAVLQGQTTSGATAELGEPAGTSGSGGYGPGHTVWYAWTAPSDGVATWTLTGSQIAAVGLFTGSSVNSLSAVNYSGGTGDGEIRQIVREGTTYYMSVDGEAAQFAVQVTLRRAIGTTIVVTPLPAVVENQPIILTAILSHDSSSEVAPSGTVVFQVDGEDVNWPIDLVEGTASYTMYGLSQGSHTITARYSGDGYFSASTSDAITAEAEPPVSTIAAHDTYRFVDSNQNWVTIRLIGPGSAGVQQAGGRDIYRISLYDTTAASSLSIQVAGWKRLRHTTSIREIRLDNGSLGRLSAPAVDLVGAGINTGGPGQIGSIRIHSLCNGADILLPGTAPNVQVSVVANRVCDDSDLTFGAPVKSARFADFGRSTITTPSLGMLKVTGSKRGHEGGFAGILYLTGG